MNNDDDMDIAIQNNCNVGVRQVSAICNKCSTFCHEVEPCSVMKLKGESSYGRFL